MRKLKMLESEFTSYGKIPLETEHVRIYLNTVDLIKKRTVAVEKFLADLGFTEGYCQSYKTTKRGTTIPDYDSWLVDFKAKTYRKARYYNSGDIIVNPFEIENFMKQFPGMIAGLNYGI
jgi:hypothetical protein